MGDCNGQSGGGGEEQEPLPEPEPPYEGRSEGTESKRYMPYRGNRRNYKDFQKYTISNGEDSVDLYFGPGARLYGMKREELVEMVGGIYESMAPELKENVNEIYWMNGNSNVMGYMFNNEENAGKVFMVATKQHEGRTGWNRWHDEQKISLQESLAHTMIHEAGHNHYYFDKNGPDYREWRDIQRADGDNGVGNPYARSGNDVGGYISYASEYAKTGTHEDYADSVSGYHFDPDQFRQDFPNRAAYFDRVFNLRR